MTMMKDVVRQLGTAAGLNDEEIKRVIDSAREQLEARMSGAQIPPERLEELIYQRAAQSLKLRATRKGEIVRGFFFAQSDVRDFAEFSRKRMMDRILSAGAETLTSHGIDASSATEDQLYEAGVEALKKMTFQANGHTYPYITEDGQWLYDEPAWKAGKPIPEHEYRRTAYGLFDFGDGPVYTVVNIYDDDALTPLPLYRMGELTIGVNNNRSTGMEKYGSYRGFTVTGDGYVNFEEYIPKLYSSHPEWFASDLDNLRDIASGDRREFIFVKADVLRISPAGNSTAIGVTDHTILTGEDEITFWLEESRPIEMVDEALDVIFAVSPYIKQNGELSGTCLGYWVMDAFRPIESDGKPSSPEDLGVW